jgi:SAM-dependent methyltransferase
MDSSKDAYGREIMAYLKGESCFEIVERDDGYFDVSKVGPQAYFSEYRDWPQHEKTAMKYLRGRILDVGCGAGRHSLYLQSKGFDVVAIDNSPLAVKVCQERGVKDARVLSIENIGKINERFDTILMLGNNFGLFGGFKKTKSLLKDFHKITNSQAVIIAESLNIRKTDNPEHKKYQELNRKRGRMPGQIRIRIRFQKYVSDWFDYLLVSKEEMEGILKGTGWAIRKFIDSDAPKYIAIIKKNECIRKPSLKNR